MSMGRKNEESVKRLRIKERFNYEPKLPERWCVHFGDKIYLIVIHPDRPPIVITEGTFKRRELSVYGE